MSSVASSDDPSAMAYVIAGSVVTVLLAAVIVLVAIFCLYKKRCSQDAKEHVEEGNNSYIHITSRDQPIMLIFLPIMLRCSAQKSYLLCSKLCSRIRIVLSLLSLFVYKFA